MKDANELSEAELDRIWLDQAETVEEIKDEWLSELEDLQEKGNKEPGNTQELKRRYYNAFSVLETLENEYDRREYTEPPTEKPTPWDEIAEMIKKSWATSRRLTPGKESRGTELERNEEFRDRLTDIQFVTDERAENLITYFEETMGQSDYETPLEIVENEDPIGIKGVGESIWNDVERAVRGFYRQAES